MVRRQQVNINTAGEEEIQTLPGVSFIQARRICMERPFRSTEELMRVRGVSVGLLQQWEEGLFEIKYEDPFLAYEEAHQSFANASTTSPAFNIPSPAPSKNPHFMPSPAPSNHSKPTPSMRRPPLPRPRSHDSSRKKSSHKFEERGVSDPPPSDSAPSPRDEDNLNSSSSADLEKLVALVHRQQDARLRRIAVSRMVRTIILSIAEWRGYMLHRKRRGEVEFGILLQRLRTSSKDHLAAWLTHTRKCCRMRKLGVSMLLRVLGRYRARAFLCWKEFCEGLSTMGAKYANLLARGYTCCLADHFQAWSEQKSRNRRSLSHVMVRTISTLLHSQRRAWNAWEEASYFKKTWRSIRYKVGSKWLILHVRQSLQAWRQCTALSERAANMRTGNEALRITKSAKECLANWRSITSRKKQIKQVLTHRIIMCWRGMQAKAFVNWHEHTKTTRRWGKALMRSVIKFEKKLIFSSFYRWNRLVCRSAELSSIGIHIIAKNMERNLRLIFGCWREASVRFKLWLNVQRKVMKIDKQIHHREFFNAWRDVVGRRMQDLLKMVEGWKEYKNPSGREGARLVQMLHRWREFAQDGAKLRHTGVKVLLKWLQFTVNEMFLRWHLVAGFGTRTQMLQIGLRWTTAALSKIFEEWKRRSKLMQTRQIKHARARLRVIWHNKRDVIRSWNIYTYDARRLWHAGSVILSRWTTGLLFSTLSHWVHMVNVGKKMTEVTVAAANIAQDGIPATSDSPRELIPSGQSMSPGNDPWNAVVTALSADQRMGIHMLGMQRTWGMVSKIFAAWAAMTASQLPPPHWSLNQPPPEPGHPPPHIALPVNVRLKLGMNYSTVGQEGSQARAGLEQTVVQDLSRATGANPSCFHIKQLSPGSIIVDAVIHADPSGKGPAAQDVAAELDRQFRDVNSLLRNGTVTCYLEAIAFPSSVMAPTFPMFSSQSDVHNSSRSNDRRQDNFTSERVQRQTERQPDSPSDVYATQQPGWPVPPSPTPYAPTAQPDNTPASKYSSSSPVVLQWFDSQYSSPSPTSAVVMSNFPRQQFTPVPASEGGTPPISPAHSSAQSRSGGDWSNRATAGAGTLTASFAKSWSPRQVRSPHASCSSSLRSSRESWEPKTAILGGPVTQSLTPSKRTSSSSGPTLSSTASDHVSRQPQSQEPTIYLL